MIAASVALVVLLAGCAAAGRDSIPSFSRSPGKATASGKLPSGSAIDEWADAALPASRPGGASFVVRASGAITADSPALLTLTQPEGTWDVTVVCQSADGSPLGRELSTAGTTPGPLACGAPDQGLVGDIGTITYEGGATLELTLTTTTHAVFAYTITPHGAGQD